MVKQTRKSPKEPTMKIEEKKRTGPEGKAGEGLVGWVRPLYARDENDRLVWCSPPSSATIASKRGDTLCAKFATKKFPSTNIAGRLPDSICINTMFIALATLR